jgi:hypothetical protein
LSEMVQPNASRQPGLFPSMDCSKWSEIESLASPRTCSRLRCSFPSLTMTMGYHLPL